MSSRWKAYCRWLGSAEADAHWQARHDDDLPLRAEILSKLDHIRATATARGWVFPKEGRP